LIFFLHVKNYKYQVINIPLNQKNPLTKIMETKHGLKPLDLTRLGGPKFFIQFMVELLLLLYIFNYFKILILKINFEKLF